jgi:predicted RNA-binding Zn-ribbon protein involved in translation (DUF1610 family)
MSHSHLRTVRFSPYRRGAGPTFTLTMRDAGTTDNRGVTTIAYRLTMREPGASKSAVIFDAADYHGSPGHGDDSDQNVEGLMGFLTLRPGDTDEEYFASYTPEQLAFAASHAEALSGEVSFRFQCPDCGSALEDGACHSHGKVRRAI